MKEKTIKKRLLEEYKDLFTHYDKSIVEEVKATVGDFINLTKQLTRKECEEQKDERCEKIEKCVIKGCNEKQNLSAMCERHTIEEISEEARADERRKILEEVEKHKLIESRGMTYLEKGDIFITKKTWDTLKKEVEK